MSKACDIPKAVKNAVWERDQHCCIFCGSPYAMPNMHYIPRSQGGLGIEQNIVTACIVCHNNYDNGNDIEQRRFQKQLMINYLKSIYPGWNEKNLIYRKG